jgi:putative hydrolase of the HAD superfamily
MIWIFDLDETLYDESTYVKSGLRHVAQHIADQSDLNVDDLFNCMESEFRSRGRANVFQRLTSTFPNLNHTLDDLISIYRKHVPTIELYADALEILTKLHDEKLYLVTDGNRHVQWNKIRALELEEIFKGIFVTDEHGLGAAKPGIVCFSRIKSECESDWSNMVYIGDDPHKDFLHIRKLGMRTIRVNRGRFKDVVLDSRHEAEITVDNLIDIEVALSK